MKRTDAFIATLNHSHDAIYNELRSIVSVFNTVEGTSFRLMRQGRLGKNNPNATLYNQMIDRRLYRRVRISEAGHFDLYLYNREWNKHSFSQEKKLGAVLRAWVSLASL